MAIFNRTLGNTKVIIAAVSGTVQGAFNIYNSSIEYGVDNTSFLKTAKSDTDTLFGTISADNTTEHVNQAIGNVIGELTTDFFKASPKQRSGVSGAPSSK